jgi:hypothetical protein
MLGIAPGGARWVGEIVAGCVFIIFFPLKPPQGAGYLFESVFLMERAGHRVSELRPGPSERK